MSASKQMRTIRNRDFYPYIDSEGCYRKCFPTPPCKSDPWHKCLSAHERLFFHQTLNSGRRFAGFVASDRIPKDSLDLVLLSRYQHGNEIFADKVDTVLSHETVGRSTFRRLRNTKDVPPQRVIAIGHPLKFGGICEKISPDSVKLMCSGPHTPLTNPGYSRQTGDGNVFMY